MKRSHAHLAVDVGLAAAGLGVLATGLLLEFVLPPGSRQSTVASWTRHAWGDAHLYLALGLLALAAVHVTLNWAWVCNVIAKATGRQPARPGTRRAAGLVVVVALAAVIAGLLLLASWVKVEDTSHRDGGGRGMGLGRLLQDHDGPYDTP